jgi:hypothetical protein
VLPKAEADALFVFLRDRTEWQHQVMRLYGKAYELPRLTAWYGDLGGYRFLVVSLGGADNEER